MGKIVAIGGGEIGRPKEEGRGHYPVETTPIDKEILRLTGKDKPSLLFLPTASGDSKGYYEVVKKHFTKIGFETSVLYLFKEKNYDFIRKKILESDAVYVGGGNTLRMMKLWRRRGVDKILKEAYDKNIVLSGLSAGSICWFKYGNSDSRKFSSNSTELIKVKGLGFINAFHCPHYNLQGIRRNSVKKMMSETTLAGITLDNCIALVVEGDEYRIVKSKKDAKAYKVYWKSGEYYEEEIKPKKEYENLKSLLKIK